ncbi:MAG: hypothetical protein COV34_01235 [Candidatus Zambryskibacteria bacterium CG10_big_fil_rev_8_21_14_0_10_42_12]|uniref:DUF11 domain-containing protein n=1 Tax=Candidatus Zambryskibacteria bacterium CG10_big_fil_rev_8_21_14_0_10_42_12 TaxID=1975115 RepID=A0A2H0QVA5_9BACT|nr:MAG: hypothetical protein COV34_01235 [Candidatus Zambryskibacteria bacterium CG10_big_fil_rev_8_21_14_0_10_42_12]
MYFGGYKKDPICEQVLAIWIALVLVCVPGAPLYAEEGGDAEINTGDATVSVEATNSANNNVVDTEPEPDPAEEEEQPESVEEQSAGESDGSTEEGGDDEGATSSPSLLSQEQHELATSTATSTDPVAQTEVASTTGTTTTHTTIDIDNEAHLESGADLLAQTGENTATSTGTTTIETGDAYANVNILNIANTNIIDSYGFMLLLNSFMGDIGTIDFRDFIAPLLFNNNQQSSCGTGVCGGDDTLDISGTSTTTINNAVIVRSQTGGNSASGGDASIQTGDAYAGANVVNIANTNIVDSNYMLLALNNFGDWSGDLVLPGKDFFINMLYGMGTTGAGTVTVNTENNANIENGVSTVADTGGNTATSTESGANIETGNATAQTNVTNVVNQNFFNQDSLFIIFKVHGTWSGNVFGLPPGLSWRETPHGIEVFGSGQTQTGSSGTGLNNLSINQQNNADIKNNVELYALTGENEAGGGNTSIQTGNAYAGANVVNMANTNIIGRNWILAIVNIFGDWNGNLAFGRPDLWIGGKIEPVNPMSPIGPGSELRYKVVVVNRGDSDATDVVLKHRFDVPFVSFVDTSNPQKVNERDTLWNIGTIAVGEHVEITLPAVVKSAREIVSGTTRIESMFEVTSFETDADSGDNKEHLSVVIDNYDANLSPVNLNPNIEEPVVPVLPDFSVVKTSSTHTTVASSTVEYTVTLKNNGGFAPDAVVIDALKDENGNIVFEQVWQLGPVYENEEITITYGTIFSGDMEPGLYTNTAEVIAKVSTDSEDVIRSSADAIVALEAGVVVEPPVIPAPVVQPVRRQIVAMNDTYGITLIPPMCSLYSCLIDTDDEASTQFGFGNMFLASAFGSGFPPSDDRSLKLFILAAVMYAVGRPRENRHGMSLFF